MCGIGSATSNSENASTVFTLDQFVEQSIYNYRLSVMRECISYLSMTLLYDNVFEFSLYYSPF